MMQWVRETVSVNRPFSQLVYDVLFCFNSLFFPPIKAVLSKVASTENYSLRTQLGKGSHPATIRRELLCHVGATATQGLVSVLPTPGQERDGISQPNPSAQNTS